MRSRYTLALAALLILLATVAVLQYRWIGQVSDAEQERLRSSLLLAARQLADGVDREVSRASICFEPDRPARLRDDKLHIASCWSRWCADAPRPELIQEVYLLQQSERGETRLSRFEPSSGTWSTVEPRGDLELVVQRAATERPVRRVDGRLPAVLVPLRAPVPQALSAPDHAVAILRFDRSLVVGTMLPELVATYFGSSEETLFTVAVSDPTDGEEIFRSPTQGEAPSPGTADVQRDLFMVREFPELRLINQGARRPPLRAGPPPRMPQGERFRPPQGEWPRPPQGSDPRPPRGTENGPRQQQPPDLPADPQASNDDAFRPEALPGVEPERGVWLLTVSHRAGSVHAVVAEARTKNLAVSAAILLLLGGSAVMLGVSARRAQRLARLQLEFVAGVSHELKTPLAAIRSAAQNLADGVVSDENRIRQYGSLLDREGRRLSQMVHELLELAGLHGKPRNLQTRPLRIEEVIHAAVDDLRWAIQDAGIEVQTRIPADLPAVLGDPEALRRVLDNLVGNAVKHGGQGRWVGIRVSRTALGGRPAVECAVSDRGQGIARSDLAHVFEPFYRGHSHAAQASGSGLGLAIANRIVERHGGRMSVASRKGGTTFAFTILAADEDTGG